MTHVYNFSSGPAMLPVAVLASVQQELCNWQSLGTSVMEISHRSKEFIQVAEQAEQDLRDLLQIPENYRVLFCQGGARGQFSAVPLNLLGKHHHADYIDGGYWAQSAIKEAQKYCTPHVINVAVNINEQQGILPMKQWILNDDAAYIHYCINETIDGIAINEVPDFGDRLLVADYSSAILSRPIDVSRYAVIYAGAQKNIGPAGITVVIVREDLLGHARSELPSILDYTILAKSGSMFNTPPTFPWYLSGMVFRWLKEQGGLAEMEQRNRAKAELLYGAIDASHFYHNRIAQINRSWMNVPFQLADTNLDSLFLKESEAQGLKALKGHRVVGGMRASIYNAMPIEGVKALTDFMAYFERRYG